MAKPSLTAQTIADLVGGRLSGPGTPLISRVAALDRAGPDSLSILSSAKYLEDFRSSRAGAVIIDQTLADEPLGPPTRIVVDDPGQAILTLSRELEQAQSEPPGVHPSAILGQGVSLGEDDTVGPNCVLGRDVRLGSRTRLGPGVILEDGVTLGDDVHLGAHVVCHRGTEIGDRVVVQAGAIIGGVGFGFHTDETGPHRLPHLGRCVIEDDVEIGSNTCIDRGSLDDTVVGQGTKIDNLVMVAHNVRIGKFCFIAAEVGISGSARIGDQVMLGGQVGTAGHITIGDGARIGAQGGVTASVPAGANYSGYPARPHREQLRGQAAMNRLGKIVKQLEALVKESQQDG